MKEINTFTEIKPIINSSKDNIVVIDCYAPWCGPCRVLGNMLTSLTEEETKDCEIIKVNVDEAEDFVIAYPVRSVPTLLYFTKGELVDRTVGLLSKEEFITKINEIKNR